MSGFASSVAGVQEEDLFCSSFFKEEAFSWSELPWQGILLFLLQKIRVTATQASSTSTVKETASKLFFEVEYSRLE